MALSSLQILALSSFKGVGRKSILKVGDYQKDAIKSDDLPDILEKKHVRMKGSCGAKDLIMLSDITAAEEKAQELIKRSAELGIGVISYYEPEFPQMLRETKSEDGKKSDPPNPQSPIPKVKIF